MKTALNPLLETTYYQTQEVKLGTWNLCLGIKNKKDYVNKTINDLNIDICCLQETELKPTYPMDALNFKGFNYMSETNIIKARTGIYISQLISYDRQHNLEGVDSGLIIIDLHLKKEYRLINLYRVFNPVNNMTQREYFKYQLTLIATALLDTTKAVIISLMCSI